LIRIFDNSWEKSLFSCHHLSPNLYYSASFFSVIIAVNMKISGILEKSPKTIHPVHPCLIGPARQVFTICLLWRAIFNMERYLFEKGTLLFL
jgi:hypothetical protein